MGQQGPVPCPGCSRNGPGQPALGGGPRSVREFTRWASRAKWTGVESWVLQGNDGGSCRLEFLFAPADQPEAVRATSTADHIVTVGFFPILMPEGLDAAWKQVVRKRD